MSKKNSLLAVLILLALPVLSYGQTPAEFNKNLSARADSFFKLGAIWGSKLEDISAKSKHYNELKPLRLRAVDYIDVQVNELSAMKDVKDSREMRLALIEFLKFEKTLINTVFIKIEELPSYATENETEQAFAGLEQASQKEEPYLMKLTQAQDAYASNNGFKVEHKSEQELR
jgi:hypothetical protein